MGRVSVHFNLFHYGNFSRAKTSAARLMCKLPTFHYLIKYQDTHLFSLNCVYQGTCGLHFHSPTQVLLHPICGGTMKHSTRLAFDNRSTSRSFPIHCLDFHARREQLLDRYIICNDSPVQGRCSTVVDGIECLDSIFTSEQKLQDF